MLIWETLIWKTLLQRNQEHVSEWRRCPKDKCDQRDRRNGLTGSPAKDQERQCQRRQHGNHVGGHGREVKQFRECMMHREILLSEGHEGQPSREARRSVPLASSILSSADGLQKQ